MIQRSSGVLLKKKTKQKNCLKKYFEFKRRNKEKKFLWSVLPTLSAPKSKKMLF